MSSLPNYLITQRKRLSLSQEEVGFLAGMKGLGRGIKISRHENNARLPDLRTALAYEVIYGKPVRELFAGLYEQAEQDVAEHARLLRYRESTKLKPKLQEVINNLVSKIK